MSDLLSALVGAVIGSLSTYWFSVWADRKQKIRTARVTILADLVRLRGLYEGVLRDDTNASREELSNLANQIARDATLNDQLPELPGIVAVIFSTARFPDNATRLRALEEILNRMGTVISPNFIEAMETVTRENVELWTKNRAAVEAQIIPGAFVPRR